MTKTNGKNTPTKSKENKKIDRDKEIEKFQERHGALTGIDFDSKQIKLSDGGIVVIERTPHTSERYVSVSISDLTETINYLRRVRTLVKKLGFKTAKTVGKYV